MQRILKISVATLATLAACGCGMGRAPGTGAGASTPAAVTHISGRVYGGQQPVVGAAIQLYSVGTAGTGSASAPLLPPNVVTDANGNFNITGAYSCTGATQVYIVATGGNAGSGTNNALSLMAALGSCATLQANAATTFINLNELTTVATVYALGPFMADITHMGAAGSNPAGLLNGFSTAALLVSTSSGQVAAPPAGMTLPVAELNTLADIVAACVNTQGTASSQCAALFAATGATDTADAALAIARTPGAPAVTQLFSQVSGVAPFMPTLTSAPRDFTVAVNYAGTELQTPFGIAVDAAGNAWVTNEAGRSVTRLPALSSSFHTVSFIAGGFLAPRGISVDRSGNVWVANTGGNSVIKLSSTGAVLSAGVGYTAGGINAPVAVANDSQGNAFVANFNGNSVSKLGTDGTPSSGGTLTASLSAPSGVIVDTAGHLAVANAGNGTVCQFDNTGTPLNCLSDNTLFAAAGVAASGGGLLAAAGSTTGAAVSGGFLFGTTAGAVNAASPVTAGVAGTPAAVAFDGAGTLWLTGTASLSAFNGTAAVSPAAGYGSLQAPQGLAIDASGNIWTANTGDNSVSVFIGAATPVVTPLAAIAGP